MKNFELYISKVGFNQLFITAAVHNALESFPSIAETIYGKIESVLGANGMRILYERVFGSLEFFERFTGIRKVHFGFADGPFSYIQGKPCIGEGLAGVQIHAVKSLTDEDYWIICDGNNPRGYGWKHDDTTWVYLAGITGYEAQNSKRSDQASAMFDNMIRILAAQGFSFKDIRRTWIFLEDILGWYDEFNSIRNEKLKELKLIPSEISSMEVDKLYLPASTGISGENPRGAACLGDVLAISGGIQSSVLPGALQRSAYRYGSAFSRGICIEEKDCRQIYVSGTAAIDEEGKSMFQGNVEGQIERTLEIVEALVGEKGAKLSDIRSATIYLKQPDDLSVYERIAARHGLGNMPAVLVNADICRGELLFEMDAVACVDIACRTPGDA